ncbi:hypothetical protein [Methylophilus sp. Leaf408]|uniref:hypothetical protein n=1 Tax=Methylophilus sp. Leaf408 TaxID=2876561 RepID=UPI001E59EEC9|nr:hypothetical protein [Methylophilus sp. Leaf408]
MFTIRQLFFSVLAIISINAQAKVIVDTGPSDGNLALNIYDKANGDYQKLAGNFFLEDSYKVTDIFASIIYYGSSNPNALINVSVHADQNNKPGESLFSSQLTIPATPLTSSYSPDKVFVAHTIEWVGFSNISLSLNSGSYWIVFSGVQGEPTDIGWGLFGATNRLPTYMYMTDSIVGSPPFEILPHTWGDMGGIGAGLKIIGTPLAVPEPENLAMLLAGLGLLGVAVPRNK